jgi:DNA-binding MarR family transcriptional regulator
MYSIHQLHTLVQKHLEQALMKDKSLSFSQFMVLVGFVCGSEKQVSQTSIAERTHLTEATVSRHISTLVSLGYLSRKEDTENRRKHKITITKKGFTVFKKAETVIDKELVTIFKDINEKERKSIMKNFDHVLLQLLSKK